MSILLSQKKVANFIRSIRRSLSNSILEAFDALGMKMFEVPEGGDTGIILYHGIDLKGSTSFNTRFVSKDHFEEHLVLYSKYFNVVPLKQLFDGTDLSKGFNLAITFDDGYATNVRYALPLLEKHKIPATFFVTGISDTAYPCLWPDFLDLATSFTDRTIRIRDHIYVKRRGRKFTQYYGKDGRTLKETLISLGDDVSREVFQAFEHVQDKVLVPSLEDYWRPMNNEELAELSRSSWTTIGSHGYMHFNLAKSTKTEIIRDLQMSKKYLESIVGDDIDMIAYPYGQYTHEIKRLAEAMGFDRHLAMGYIYGEEEEASNTLSRMGVNPYISPMNQIRTLVRGHY